MRELDTGEIESVGGGMSDFTAGGMTVIGIGFCGGPATAIFGLLVGGSMMFVGHYQRE